MRANSARFGIGLILTITFVIAVVAFGFCLLGFLSLFGRCVFVGLLGRCVFVGLLGLFGFFVFRGLRGLRVFVGLLCGNGSGIVNDDSSIVNDGGGSLAFAKM